MRNYQGCAISHKSVECLLNTTLRFCVKRRGCFVENQDGRIFQQCATDCYSLALPAGQQYTPVSHDCVEAIRQFVHKLEYVCRLGRLQQLVSGTLPQLTVGKIVGKINLKR